MALWGHRCWLLAVPFPAQASCSWPWVRRRPWLSVCLTILTEIVSKETWVTQRFCLPYLWTCQRDSNMSPGLNSKEYQFLQHLMVLLFYLLIWDLGHRFMHFEHWVKFRHGVFMIHWLMFVYMGVLAVIGIFDSAFPAQRQYLYMPHFAGAHIEDSKVYSLISSATLPQRL